MHRNASSAFTTLAVLALAGLLAGCSTFGAGSDSAFGAAQAPVADYPDASSYSGDAALSQARQHFRNSDFGYSAALYKRVVEVQPKDPEGYVGLGASYDRLGRFDLSDRVYASLFALTGPTAQYYNNLGYSMMLRGNLAAALGNFRKAKALDPANPVVDNNIAMLTGAKAE